MIRVTVWITPLDPPLTQEFDLEDTEAWLPYVKQQLAADCYLEIEKL